jgi:hypothetical protein
MMVEITIPVRSRNTRNGNLSRGKMTFVVDKLMGEPLIFVDLSQVCQADNLDYRHELHQDDLFAVLKTITEV